VPNPHLYLHETIHIVGAGSEPYKRHTGARTASGRGTPLVGTWQQSGSTGDWPRVVNLWEMRDWEHWAEVLAYQYRAGGRQPPELKRWWNQALRWRSGGFDRILEPAPWSPARQELIDGGVRARACLQEVATVASGRAEAYLDAVHERWAPLAARRGLVLCGAWRTAMRDTEAVLLWGAAEFATVTRHLATVGRDPEARGWSDMARTWRTDYRETLLVPSAWCVVHPDWKPPRPARRARR
jgi:hypothetical protein